MAGERAKGAKGEAAASETSAPKKKVKRAAAPASSAAPKAQRGRIERIAVVLVAWGALVIYVLDAINAATLIGLAALLAFMYYRAPEGEAKPRRMLGAGAALLLAGIGTVGIGPHEIGIGLTLLALLVMAFGIHTFGRLGPEETASDV